MVIKTPDPDLDSDPELQYLKGSFKIRIETNADTPQWW
jgi:hypothetical protein